jgi:hypothetical protein
MRFFPPPQFFSNINSSLKFNIINEDNIIEEGIREERRVEVFKEARRNAKTAREVYLYDKLVETQQFDVADGYVTVTEHFKYLGSHTSYNLRENFDIDTLITAASESMVTLSSFLDNQHIDIYSKFLLYKAIPTNLLLGGCKT